VFKADKGKLQCCRDVSTFPGPSASPVDCLVNEDDAKAVSASYQGRGSCRKNLRRDHLKQRLRERGAAVLLQMQKVEHQVLQDPVLKAQPC
jgi:hypothetical protein